jgi:hypothetical protein
MALVLWSSLLVLGTAEAQNAYRGILFPNGACTPTGIETVFVPGCANLDGASAQFLRQPGGATPPLYTLSLYNAPGCNPANQLFVYTNIPQDGTTCVPSTSSIPALDGSTSVILTNEVVVVGTTAVTVNIGAIVGAVVGGLSTIVLIVVLMRYLELCCFKPQPAQYLPTKSVNNPAAIPEFK